jgi:anti-sigma factor RsiW
MTNDEFALYDAAYVLGALSPADRRDFEDHLKVCAACAGSVSELAGLPGLMSRVSIDQLTAEPEPAPETLLPSLARAVRRERRQRRLAVGAAAAAAACLIAVGAVAITQPDSPARPPVASSASAPSGTANLPLTAVVPSPVTASARLVDMAWGTRIDLTCAYRTQGSYPASGVPYAMVVIDRNGAAEQVATWKALPNRELTVMGASSRARRDIAAVEIRTPQGRTILRLST